MKLLIAVILLSCSSLATTFTLVAAAEDVKFISDVLNVPLRSGPSAGHRILHQGLPSGTPLTVIGTSEDATFTQVRTKSGMEGWVRSQYLVTEPIARTKLAIAEKRLHDLKAKMEKERKESATLKSKYKESEASNKTLNSQVQTLTKELEQLKRIAADPIKEHARNVELTQQNTRLVSEVDELSSKTRRLEDNVQLQWLLGGGTLVLIGLLFGIFLKSRPRKQPSFSRYN